MKHDAVRAGQLWQWKGFVILLKGTPYPGCPFWTSLWYSRDGSTSEGTVEVLEMMNWNPPIVLLSDAQGPVDADGCAPSPVSVP